MTVERLLEYTEMDGLKIEYTDGELALIGTPDCVKFWKGFVSEYREQILEKMREKARVNK